jgi:hypothetical protein
MSIIARPQCHCVTGERDFSNQMPRHLFFITPGRPIYISLDISILIEHFYYVVTFITMSAFGNVCRVQIMLQTYVLWKSTKLVFEVNRWCIRELLTCYTVRFLRYETDWSKSMYVTMWTGQ